MAVAGLFAAALAGQSPACATCHRQPTEIAGTPHEKVGCLNCHPGYDVLPHPEGLPLPECGSCHVDAANGVHGSAHSELVEGGGGCQMCHGDPHLLRSTKTADFHQAEPELCGTACHGQELADFQASIHGDAAARGEMEAPVCSTCHGAHDIQPLGEGAAGLEQVPERCGSCHGDVRLTERYNLPAGVVASFQNSFHGLGLRAGSQTVASCASCHGSHKVLPSSDPASMVNPANLPATCGQCHPGAGRRFAIGQIHWIAGEAEPKPVQWVRVGYRILIPVVIGMMVLYCLGDWIRKAYSLRLAWPGGRPEGWVDAGHGAPGRSAANPRMYRAERLQHGLLIVSFSVLVWSGFALRYSDQWWARPLIAWEAGGRLRGLVHRSAGASLIALALVHAVSLAASPTLRRHWKTLRPRLSDVRQWLRAFGYNLFLHDREPVVPSHSFVEKTEYWAVVWGTVVMAITGVMLWAHNWMLAWLPKVVLDVAGAVHFYEAVLATLAIVAWHFYMVIFDPEVYPMDPAWLSGYSVRHRMAEEASDEEMAGEAYEGELWEEEAEEDEE